MSKLDFEKFENLLGSWASKLRPIIESPQMFDLYQEFKSCRDKITPKSSDIFRAFELCPMNELKLIVFLMDSYPGVYSNRTLIATGIPMDCSNTPDNRLQPSLLAFWDGLRHEFEEDIPYEKDLSFICKQGVLLANRALNCKVNKTGSFMGKWDFFWEYFFQEIVLHNHAGVPVIFLGKDAAKLRRYVFEMNNPVFELSHPSAAARQGILWETKGVFTKCNKLIKSNGATEIIWNKNELDRKA